jgi:hypothetical protein
VLVANVQININQKEEELKMASIQTLSSYAAFLYPNAGKQSGRINLYCGEYKLYILFMDPSDTIPLNSFNATNKIGVAYQPFSQYAHYMDLIRNEKPIRITFRPEDSPPVFVVYCSGETPGEGEI